MFFTQHSTEGPRTPLLMNSDESEEEEDVEACRIQIREPSSIHASDNVIPDVLIFPDEPLKTLLCALFLGIGFIITTFSLVLAHERMPEIEPLPDIVLDNISYLSWGLQVSEYLMIASTVAAFLLVLFHTHRSILFRRVFFILGLMYVYRALTFFVTSLPKSDENYYCQEKYNGSLPFQELVIRVVQVSSGGGISLNDKQVYCGDFIFSGHTMVLTTSYLVIKEYSPPNCFLLHWLSFFMSTTGVVFLLLGRGHYTVDVVIAYFITTRLWWGYHTMANLGLKNKNKYSSKENSLSKLWWWQVFRYLEKRVPGPVPYRYSLPLPLSLRTYIASRCNKKEKVDQEVVIEDS